MKSLEDSFDILDTSENSVFIQVIHQGQSHKFGILCISDAVGVRYIQDSIRNSNRQYNFERVKGLQSVYLSNIYDRDTSMIPDLVTTSQRIARQKRVLKR